MQKPLVSGLRVSSRNVNLRPMSRYPKPHFYKESGTTIWVTFWVPTLRSEASGI